MMLQLLTLLATVSIAMHYVSAAPANPASAAHHRLAAEYHAARLGISMLVMIDGDVVFEQYDNGGFPQWPHELASGTKSFTGVAAAIAVDEGLLTFDERLADTITEWRSDRQKRHITVRQLLSLTSGLHTRPGIPPGYADSIDKRAVDTAGQRFDYGSTEFQVFGELLSRKLQTHELNVEQFYRSRLFKPLEIEVLRWRHGRDGNPHLPSGIALTARDWARFGQMVIQQGQWNSKRVVSQENLAECFVGSDANPGYGLTWWLARPVPRQLVKRTRVMRHGTDLYGPRGAVPDDLVVAAGAGNQRLYVSPSLKLVVVRQAVGFRQALLGRDVGYSDVEFLSRLLYGHGADGKAAATGVALNVVDATAEAKFLQQVHRRIDANGDGEISAVEMERLVDLMNRAERRLKL